MRIKSSLGLAVGPVDATHWGQVLVLPNAYGIVEIDDSEGNAQERGVQLITKLGEKLSRDLVSLSMIEEVADTFVFPYVRSLVIFVPVGRIVYLVLRGTGEIYVKRGSELASLMHQDGGISGEVKEKDTFLLVSHGFSQVLSRGELSSLFDHLTPPDIAEKLTLLLHEKKGGEGSVALVYEASALEDSSIREPVEEVISEEIPENEQVPVQSRTPFIQVMTEKIRSVIPSHIRLSSMKRHILLLRHEPKKMTAVLVIFLLSLFVVSVTLGIYKQTTAKKDQAIVSATSDAQLAFDEGVALMSLNQVKARERLVKAKELLEPYIQTASSHSQQGYQLSLLYKKITDNLTQAMQVVDVTLDTFYDMGLLKKDAVVSSMTLDGSTIVVGDGQTGTLYAIDSISKKAQIITGGDGYKNATGVTKHGDTYYVLTENGILRYSPLDKKTTKIISPDPSWGTITSLLSFGGNLYLLDTAKSRIWKYVATDTGFSEIREYLNPDTLPDLSNVTDMAIDGSVWLGTTNGKILRFTQGKENTYITKGVDPAFGTKLFVYTSDEVKNIYVLDSQNNRVVVLDKDGLYLAQYHYSGTISPTSFVVSEEAKKILLPSDGKIYSITLK
jgi:hypothetical protein